MNQLLQIGIGLIPGVIIVLLLLCKRKAFGFKNIVLCTLLTCGCASMIIMGCKEAVEDGPAPATISAEKMIVTANALYARGEYREAEDMIEEYSALHGYDDECRLLQARICFAEEEYGRAKALYAYLNETSSDIKESEDVLAFINAKKGVDESDLFLIEYLEEAGENIADYGFTETSYSDIKAALNLDKSDAVSYINSTIEEEYLKNNQYIEEFVATTVAIDELGEEAADYEVLSSELQGMLEEHPELASLRTAREAAVKINLLNGAPEVLVADLGNNSPYEDLMIGAELYLNKLVGEEAFGEDYQSEDEALVAVVTDQFERLYEKFGKNLSLQEAESLRERGDAIIAQLDETVLAKLKQQLIDKAPEAGGEQSKVYMELAKIEHALGNESATDKYIKESLDTYRESSDPYYLSAMKKIDGVIESRNPGDVKNAPEYVEDALDNVMPANVTGYIEKSAVNLNLAGAADDNEISFEQAVENSIGKIKSSISLGRIGTMQFPNMSARIFVDSEYIFSEESLKENLRVKDCDIEIQDVSVRKIDYENVNILLACDISTSMIGRTGDLSVALRKFVEARDERENLAFLSFAEGITAELPFGSSQEELLRAVSSLGSDGGTDMYSALLHGMEMFPADEDAYNVIILISDGGDNLPKTEKEIEENVGKLAREKNIDIYTFGLGKDVQEDYLSMFSDCAGGRYTYISKENSLLTFYKNLHKKLYNQYEIKYTAEDTLTKRDRLLEVSLKEDGVHAFREYSLENSTEAFTSPIVSRGFYVTGLVPNSVYEGVQNYVVMLRGNQFRSDANVSVVLDGNIDYTPKVTFVDEQNYALEIPSNIACDVYDVILTYNGEKKCFTDGFVVSVEGKSEKVVFGPYVFTGNGMKKDEDGSVILSGNVKMNGWLNFWGNVTLKGDFEKGNEIEVRENSGSYIMFNETTAEGVAKDYAQNGESFYVPALQYFKLYREIETSDDYEDYRVDEIVPGKMQINRVLLLDSPTLCLYPNRISLMGKSGTTLLPFQDQLVEKINESLNLFRFNCYSETVITDRNIGLIMKMNYKDADRSNYNHNLRLFGAQMSFNGSMKVEVNTLKEEYLVGFMVRTPFFAKQSGLGAEIGWKKNVIDSAKVSLNLPQPLLMPTSIPIEVNDFFAGTKEMSVAWANKDWTNVMFYGGATFSMGSLSTYAPGLVKYLGDINFAELSDTTFSLRLNPFTAMAGTKVKLLGEITIGEVDAKIGNFDYTNSLLGLKNEGVKGLSFAVKKGVEWDSENGQISFALTGTNQFDAHSRFAGFTNTGRAAIDVEVWLFNFEEEIESKVSIGLYESNSKKQFFVVTGKYEKDGKKEGFFFYLDEDGKAGDDSGILR